MAGVQAVRENSTNLLPNDIDMACFGQMNVTRRARRQGYRYFVQGYLHKIRLQGRSNGEIIGTAKCYRSMRKNESPHSLHVCLDVATKLITSSICSCTVGLSGCCSHLVGLVQAFMHYQQWGMKEIPIEMSCTELQQRWGRPRGHKIKPTSVMSLTCAKAKPVGQQKCKPITATLTKQRVVPATPTDIENLRGLQDTPLAYLLNPELPVEQTVLGPVQVGSLLSYHVRSYEDRGQPSQIVPCGDTAFPLDCGPSLSPVTVPAQYLTCNDICPLSFDDARQLERKTIKQAESDTWFTARVNRITASTFHRIVKLVKDFNDKFIGSMLSSQRSGASIPCTYGTANENVAKEKYCMSTPDVHIHECGLVVNPNFCFLGATPDAKVCCKCVTGILEIKCPYTARNMTVTEAVHTLPTFCLIEQDGRLTLDRKHDYYCQVQGQLLITGAPFCDFVVYTKCDIHIQRISPDHDFQIHMIDKLSSFYYRYALPYLKKQ